MSAPESLSDHFVFYLNYIQKHPIAYVNSVVCLILSIFKFLGLLHRFAFLS